MSRSIARFILPEGEWVRVGWVVRVRNLGVLGSVFLGGGGWVLGLTEMMHERDERDNRLENKNENRCRYAVASCVSFREARLHDSTNQLNQIDDHDNRNQRDTAVRQIADLMAFMEERFEARRDAVNAEEEKKHKVELAAKKNTFLPPSFFDTTYRFGLIVRISASTRLTSNSERRCARRTVKAT